MLWNTNTFPDVSSISMIIVEIQVFPDLHIVSRYFYQHLSMSWRRFYRGVQNWFVGSFFPILLPTTYVDCKIAAIKRKTDKVALCIVDFQKMNVFTKSMDDINERLLVHVGSKISDFCWKIDYLYIGNTVRKTLPNDRINEQRENN